MKLYAAPEFFAHRSREGYSLRWGCLSNTEVGISLAACRRMQACAIAISDAVWRISNKKLSQNKKSQ